MAFCLYSIIIIIIIIIIVITIIIIIIIAIIIQFIIIIITYRVDLWVSFFSITALVCNNACYFEIKYCIWIRVNLSAKAVINGENNTNFSNEEYRQLQQIKIKIRSYTGVYWCLGTSEKSAFLNRFCAYCRNFKYLNVGGISLR